MDTPDRLLAAACNLLLEQGLAGFSMRKVAAACGLSATAIYRHFQDRDELLSAVVQQGVRLFASYVEDALAEDSPLERFRRTVRRSFDFAEEHPRYYELLFMARSGELGVTRLGDGARAELERTFGFFIDRIAECQAAGQLRYGDPTCQAACVWASVHGLAGLMLEGRFAAHIPTFSLQQLGRQQLEQVLQGLLPSRERYGQ